MANSNVIKGQIYFPHLYEPNPSFDKKSYWYELFLAVSDKDFENLKQQGISDVFLFEPGVKKYTPDPIVKIATWANNSDGSPTQPPRVVDEDRNILSECDIGNGSTVRVQWYKKTYGGQGKTIVRPQLVAVQILDLVEREDSLDRSNDALAFE
tara:strand:+ start:648 stop:1106 length:459 start_codon:yes stop_codon:yes gene_type:complete